MSHIPEIDRLFNLKIMSSLEIANIADRPHANVLFDIEIMFENLEEDESSVSKFAHTYLDDQNREQKEYHLPRREALLVLLGYDARLRAIVIDRMMHLSGEPALEDLLYRLPYEKDKRFNVIKGGKND